MLAVIKEYQLSGTNIIDKNLKNLIFCNNIVIRHACTQPNTVALLSQVQTKLEPLQNCQRTQSDVKGWVGL
jgi:hypothetical protein